MLMAFAVVVLPSFSQQGLDCEVSFSAGYGSGDFAPYYISSLKHGRFSSSKNLQAEISVSRAMNKGDRFSYGYSADVIAGYASGGMKDMTKTPKDGCVILNALLPYGFSSYMEK